MRECPPGHTHKGIPINEYGRALQGSPTGAALNETLVTCPRCEEQYTHLHGGVCGFCADELERLDSA